MGLETYQFSIASIALGLNGYKATTGLNLTRGVYVLC